MMKTSWTKAILAAGALLVVGATLHASGNSRLQVRVSSIDGEPVHLRIVTASGSVEAMGLPEGEGSVTELVTPAEFEVRRRPFGRADVTMIPAEEAMLRVEASSPGRRAAAEGGEVRVHAGFASMGIVGRATQ